jgi:hypothetical protein
MCSDNSYVFPHDGHLTGWSSLFCPASRLRFASTSELFRRRGHLLTVDLSTAFGPGLPLPRRPSSTAAASFNVINLEAQRKE